MHLLGCTIGRWSGLKMGLRHLSHSHIPSHELFALIAACNVVELVVCSSLQRMHACTPLSELWSLSGQSRRLVVRNVMFLAVILNLLLERQQMDLG